MMNVSRMAAPTPPELEFWRGRGLQTPTGPMDRDFGSSLSLQDKLVELPSTSSSLHGPHFEPPETPKCPSSPVAQFPQSPHWPARVLFRAVSCCVSFCVSVGFSWFRRVSVCFILCFSLFQLVAARGHGLFLQANRNMYSC